MPESKKLWGVEGTIISTDDYSARIYVISPNKETGETMHRKRDKTIFITQGSVQVTLKGTTRTLKVGERVHIPPKTPHKFRAVNGEAIILEVGTKFDEKDLVVL